MCGCVLSRFRHIWLSATPWTIALSMGFSRSGLPCPPSEDLSNPGSNPCVLCLLYCRQILYHWATGEAQSLWISFKKKNRQAIKCWGLRRLTWAVELQNELELNPSRFFLGIILSSPATCSRFILNSERGFICCVYFALFICFFNLWALVLIRIFQWGVLDLMMHVFFSAE